MYHHEQVAASGGADQLFAPMPGRVVVVKAAVGAQVEAGQELIVIEAMKMELSLKAPRAGIGIVMRAACRREPVMVATADKIALIDRLTATGLQSIEATSFVSPKWVPQLADAAEVFAGITRKPGVHYPVLVPNEQGYERARSVGAEEIAVFSAASEAFNRRNINAGLDESLARFAPVRARAPQGGARVRGYVSTVLGCPYQGDVPLADVVRVAKALHAMGCYEVSLGDTIGVGTPIKARAMLRAVAGEVPMAALAVHLHD